MTSAFKVCGIKSRPFLNFWIFERMFTIPSLPNLLERARDAFRSFLPGTDAWLWPNNIAPTAKVVAGMTHEVFGFADYIAKQRFVTTADSENLDRHGEQYGIARRPASPASGIITLTCTGAVSVAAGALFQRSDGAQYTATIAVATLSSGALDVPAVAVIAGQAGLNDAGASLTITSGVTGTATAVIGSGGMTLGADVEDDESYRARILFRLRNPPHGGSAADYVMWGSEVPSVTRVFVERLWQGAGTVRVLFMMDDAYANGVPLAGDVTRVREYIQLFKPATAQLTVAAPTAQPINITITGLEPSNAATQNAVRAELAAAIRRLGRVAGVDSGHASMPYLATPFTFSRSWLWQAIANATGEERHTLTLPSADVVITAGNVPTLGTVTFA
jgi:uncharacterized phage protein gp47/JayE